MHSALRRAAEDVLVEPLEQERSLGRHPVAREARASGDVRPRPDQEPGVGVVGQALVEERLAALEDVVEPADDEGRRRDAVDRLDRRALPPVGPVVGRLAAEHAAGDGGQLELGDALDVVEEHIGRRRRLEAEAGDEPDPGRDEGGVDLAAGEHDVAVGVGHRHGGEHRLHGRVAGGGGEERRDAHVRPAGDPDAPVAPALAHDPVEDLAVVGLGALAPRVPGAARGTRAPVVDEHRGVAVAGQAARAAPQRRRSATTCCTR